MAALPVVVQADEPRTLALPAYLELGTRYRAGDVDGAVLDLLSQPKTAVDEAVGTLFRSSRSLRACSDGPDAIETATVEALVLLHLDAIRRIGPDTRFQADTAARVFEWLRHTTAATQAPTGCAFTPHIAHREFYFVLSGLLQGRNLPDDALRAANKGLEDGTAGALQDASLLLAAACAHEQRARVRISRLTWNPPQPGGPADNQSRGSDGEYRAPTIGQRGYYSQERVVAPDRAKALKLLTQILQRTPEAHAARLRRGRGLALRREYEAAEADLRLAAQAPEPPIRYLAELFLGEVREKLQDPKGAAESYARAISARPQAQAARLGLARLLVLAGHGLAARSQAQALLAHPWSTDLHDDPWWAYPFGTWPEAEALLDVLRLRVMER